MERDQSDSPISERTMLEARIREAPHLVVNYVRLARLLEDSGDRKGAAEAMQQAHFFLPNGRAIIDSLKRLSGWVDPTRKPITVSQPTSPAQPEIREEPSEDPALSRPALDDELDQLIEGLGKGRMGETEAASTFSEEEWTDEEGLLATETLAHIFLSQNQFEEALRVYDRLAQKEKDPEKAADLREKAAEVRKKLRRLDPET